jgi:hypothetical protein
MFWIYLSQINIKFSLLKKLEKNINIYEDITIEKTSICAIVTC